MLGFSKKDFIMGTKSQWHIWVIRQFKFDTIQDFLQRDVKEVEEVFFPTVLKECRVGKKVQKRRVPLYSGYLFLKYVDNDSSVYYKIRSNPFITSYVGLCEQASVEEMKKKEEWKEYQENRWKLTLDDMEDDE